MGTFMGYPAGFAAGPVEPPTLQVTGVGEAGAAPDTARLTLGFTARAPQAAAAYEQTAAALNRVVQALMQAGLAADQMQTQEVALNPVFDRPRDGGESRLTGYEATATLAVILRDLVRVGAIIDLAVSAGANRVDGVQFTVRERERAEAAALTQAVQDAQRQAAVLARALGVALGPVREVSTEAAPGPSPYLARSAAEGIPVLPGRLTVVRTVRLAYQIHPSVTARAR